MYIVCNGLRNCASHVKIKVRLSLCPTWRNVGGLETQLQSFLTSEVVGGEWSVSRPRHFSTFPPVTREYHISQLRSFLLTVLYVENCLVSKFMHCQLLEKNWEKNVFMSSGRKMGRYFLQVRLLSLVHTDTQLNKCCLLFQLRNGIDAVPEVLYRCLFKRCWMN